MFAYSKLTRKIHSAWHSGQVVMLSRILWVLDFRNAIGIPSWNQNSQKRLSVMTSTVGTERERKLHLWFGLHTWVAYRPITGQSFQAWLHCRRAKLILILYSFEIGLARVFRVGAGTPWHLFLHFFSIFYFIFLAFFRPSFLFSFFSTQRNYLGKWETLV